MADRLLRWCRTSNVSGHCDQVKAVVELVDSDVLRVTLPPTGRLWCGGQYA